MAEAKYDLLLVNTRDENKKIYNQPWYKERLKTRYLKSLGPTDTSKFLHGQNWIFLKDGLDDFRDGLPPPVDSEFVNDNHKRQKGPAPNIHGSSDVTSVKQPAATARFNKNEVCYSRVTPLQQQRREHIEEIEYGLTQHPLALYPHLEEGLPPDVFEDVVDVLDPAMNLVDEEDEEDEYLDEETESEGTPPPQQEPEREQSSEPEEQKIRNPYRWLPRKDENVDKKDKKKASDRRSSPSQDEHINGVTKDFCDWVASLGGESNNIEESTITSLFASGYETKPALSVPIHVVELTNVPPELRQSATVPQQQAQKVASIPTDDSKTQWSGSATYTPSWVKFKYGAWYLSPRSWKKRPAENPLQDPKELKDQQMSEAKVKSNELDNELAPMHGAKAFMDFIDKKTVRQPEFLKRVGDIQELQEKEEQTRLEAELAKQKKMMTRNASAK